MAEKDNKRPQFQKFTTPKGVAVFPKLNKPDEFKGKKTYNTKLKLTQEEAAPFIAKIEEEAEKAYQATVVELEEKAAEAKGAKKGEAKAKLAKLTKADLPFKPEYDDEGEPTDNVIFSFKMNASYEKDGKVIPLSPYIFDAKKTLLKNPPEIWGGSILKVSGVMKPFYIPAQDCAGVSLKLDAVQIIELRSRGSGGTADAYGFSDEEGYSGSEEDAPPQEGGDTPADGGEGAEDNPNF